MRAGYMAIAGMLSKMPTSKEQTGRSTMKKNTYGNNGAYYADA